MIGTLMEIRALNTDKRLVNGLHDWCDRVLGSLHLTARTKEQENQASAQDDALFSLLCDRLTAYLLRQTAWEFRDRRFFVRECLWNAMILELSGPTSWT